MNLEEMQEALESMFELEDLAPQINISISKKNGEVVIYTGLCQDNNGELTSLEDEDSDYDEDAEIEDSFGTTIIDSDEDEEEVIDDD